MSHTPGPLKVEKLKTDGGNPMHEGGGVFFNLVATKQGVSRSVVVADTYHRDCMLDDDEDEANAERMALTWNMHDELVAALEGMLMCTIGGYASDIAAIKAARAVVDKIQKST